MEFHVKLQELRKRKGLTQEELAEALYVSRTAVSKWESGRGYPTIDSLKSLAAFFSVTVDELLSSGEVLTISEEEQKRKETHTRDLVYGLLDCAVALLLFLPFFGQKAEGVIHEVSLLTLGGVSPVLKGAYLTTVSVTVLWGILLLALQTCSADLWVRVKDKASLLLSAAGALLFIVSLQPYAASLLFVFLILKGLLIIKWR